MSYGYRYGYPKRSTRGPASVSYDADAELFFAAMSVAPDASWKGYYNDLTVALKAADAFSKMPLLHILAAHDEQAARLNVTSPGSNSLTGTATFVAGRGFTGNGVDQELDCQRLFANLPGVGVADDHLGIYVGTDVNEARGDFGANGNPGIRTRSSGNYITRNGSANDTTAGSTTSIGHTLINRSNVTDYDLYKDGALVANISRASGAFVAVNTKILSQGGLFSTKQVSIVHAGPHLADATMVAAVRSAFVTFLTATGAPT